MTGQPQNNIVPECPITYIMNAGVIVCERKVVFKRLIPGGIMYQANDETKLYECL